MRVLKALFEGTVLATAIIAVIAIGVGIGIPLGNLFIQPKVEKVTEEVSGEPLLRGSAFETGITDIVGIFPTTTSISSFNTEDISTTTPTSTDYVSIGPNVAKVNLHIIANATSTEIKRFMVDISIAPSPKGVTTTKNYFGILSSTVSSGVRTWTQETNHNLFTLLAAGYKNFIMPICNSNYDGSDDIPDCTSGSYKIEIGKIGFTGVEIYAGIDRQ